MNANYFWRLAKIRHSTGVRLLWGPRNDYQLTEQVKLQMHMAWMTTWFEKLDFSSRLYLLAGLYYLLSEFVFSFTM